MKIQEKNPADLSNTEKQFVPRDHTADEVLFELVKKLFSKETGATSAGSETQKSGFSTKLIRLMCYRNDIEKVTL